jgi:hypothetical protein
VYWRRLTPRVRPPPSSQPPRAPDLLLDGLALMITESYPAGTPTLKQALSAFRSQDISREEEICWLWLASRAAALLWDDDTWDVLATRHVQLARDAGALTVLPPPSPHASTCTCSTAS